MANHTCNIAGCTYEATCEVVYVLRAKEGDTPSHSTPIARVCKQHAQTNLWTTFWNRKNWETICNVFEQAGMKRPSTGYSNVKTQPIGTSKESINIKVGLYE